MHAKTLIAIAVAGLLAAPVAFAQTGASGSGTGPAGMDQRSAEERTPTASDADKGVTGRSATDPSAKPKKSAKRAKRDADRISRNERGTTADTSPNMERNPRTPGNPPKQGGSPEPQ